jgi:hypothetical protein
VTEWLARLQVDPIPVLLASESLAVRFFAQRDLRDQHYGQAERLSELPGAVMLLRKQREDGAWRYPGQNRKKRPEINYDLLETYRSLSQLVDKYGLDRRHPAVQAAAEYVFSCQTDEGDIRGILGTQYMPYYHAIITEYLNKAGYAQDSRVEKGMEWLLSVLQDDGGWLIPLQAVPAKEKVRELWSAPPVPPDRTKPSSHLATGMVLRAFATHPQGRRLKEAQDAARVLKSRFFRADRYSDRKAPAYWFKFQYPFWWSNLLTALDSLSLMGFSCLDQDIQEGLDWFAENQQHDGLWRTSYEQAKRREPSPKEREQMEWVSISACRVFKRFYGVD